MLEEGGAKSNLVPRWEGKRVGRSGIKMERKVSGEEDGLRREIEMMD